MRNYQAVSRERHATQRWQRATRLTFAAGDALSPLVVQEVSKAALSLPIAFVAIEGAYAPVAVQGLVTGKNLFVALDGRWLGGYVPMGYRGYPFVLANTADGKQALCMDEDSGLLSHTDGELFFDGDGEPSKALADVLAFHTQLASNRKSTLHVCAVLQQHNVIQPWPIKVKGVEGVPAGEQTIEGLFRIDEAAMNRLPAEAYLELRDSGALILAFCQLLSMQHLPLLGQLADAHAKAATPLPVAGKDLDLSFMSDGDTISFGWTG